MVYSFRDCHSSELRDTSAVSTCIDIKKAQHIVCLEPSPCFLHQYTDSPHLPTTMGLATQMLKAVATKWKFMWPHWTYSVTSATVVKANTLNVAIMWSRLAILLPASLLAVGQKLIVRHTKGDYVTAGCCDRQNTISFKSPQLLITGTRGHCSGYK